VWQGITELVGWEYTWMGMQGMRVMANGKSPQHRAWKLHLSIMIHYSLFDSPSDIPRN
jgi:hypothetical protein